MSDWAKMVPLSTQGLDDLINNRVAAIVIPDFATQEECQQFAKVISQTALEYYKVGRPAGYVGTTFVHYMKRPKGDYFNDVAAASSAVKAVTDQAFDPLERFKNTIRKHTDYAIGLAEEPGYGSYFAGIIRNLSGGANIHIDFAPQFAKGKNVVGEVETQMAWNVYIDQPYVGGETTVWNKQWNWTGDPVEDSKYPEFTREGLSGVESLTFKGKPGSVVIFNSRNPHHVHEVPQGVANNRIGMGSFMGPVGSRNLIMWS
jgi:hypothetical protein